MKSIRLTKHASGYLDMRGFTTEEVEFAIRKNNWIPVTRGRFECSMEFPFDSIWNGKPYKIKQVRPIFVEEELEIVVVTVYTYFY
jgi:hypothetical protein